MSPRIGLLAEAGGLIARLYCTLRSLHIFLAPDHLRCLVGFIASRAGYRSLWLCVRRARVFCRAVQSFLLTAERWGGQSRRPCRALSVGEFGIVNDGFVRYCLMGSSFLWSCVAHLASLHNSYSHRTPREGVRSLSGSSVTFDGG